MFWRERIHGWERQGEWIVGMGGGTTREEGLGSAWEVRLVPVSHTGLGRRWVGGGDGPEQAHIIEKKGREGTSLDG